MFSKDVRPKIEKKGKTVQQPWNGRLDKEGMDIYKENKKCA